MATRSSRRKCVAARTTPIPPTPTTPSMQYLSSKISPGLGKPCRSSGSGFRDARVGVQLTRGSVASFAPSVGTCALFVFVNEGASSAIRIAPRLRLLLTRARARHSCGASAEVPIPEAEVPTREADVPTREAEVPTREAEVPTREAEVPIREAEVPTREADVPTREAEVPTREADVPIREAEKRANYADPRPRLGPVSVAPSGNQGQSDAVGPSQEAVAVTLRRFGVFGAASSLAIGLVSLHAAPARAQSVSPHLSMTTLTSSNGLGALVYDATAYKITEFLEHPYQAASSSTTSRNFAYDSYPGIRVGAVGTAGTWFTGITPSVIEYLPGTGIIHTQRTFQGLTIDEYDFEPMALAAERERHDGEGDPDGDRRAGRCLLALQLRRRHRQSAGLDERAARRTTSTYDAYYEYSTGVGVTMAFGSLTAPRFHACGAAGASTNPYAVLTAGGNLGDDTGTGTTAVTGATEGFQSSLGTLASGRLGVGGVGDGPRAGREQRAGGDHHRAGLVHGAGGHSCGGARRGASRRGRRGSPLLRRAPARPKRRSSSSRRSSCGWGKWPRRARGTARSSRRSPTRRRPRCRSATGTSAGSATWPTRPSAS